jgi:hypothetical protein
VVNRSSILKSALHRRKRPLLCCHEIQCFIHTKLNITPLFLPKRRFLEPYLKVKQGKHGHGKAFSKVSKLFKLEQPVTVSDQSATSFQYRIEDDSGYTIPHWQEEKLRNAVFYHCTHASAASRSFRKVPGNGVSSEDMVINMARNSVCMNSTTESFKFDTTTDRISPAIRL